MQTFMNFFPNFNILIHFTTHVYKLAKKRKYESEIKLEKKGAHGRKFKFIKLWSVRIAELQHLRRDICVNL